MSDHPHDRDIDVRGFNCPMPILKTKKALADMQSGQVLRILATDPGSMRDFQSFAKQTGHTLLAQSEAGGEFTHWLKVK
ncbi:sulfurtransferase TusA family protein [Inhella crocodyli]|jgi:tRNA 2-thiouridine synthesizing protein A|uniref:Sulfurtransferase TusA family protein n=1 Tax=Inhella crocodyli TaxID=2499851 RepID=A0A3S2UJZ8_9BURK|nr:sulfurtransferase TusA family protein [Inhella crocodyli]RVT87893.1 sulfurtransferase TusA family protein [Inhella crocodyli]